MSVPADHRHRSTPKVIYAERPNGWTLGRQTEDMALQWHHPYHGWTLPYFQTTESAESFFDENADD